MNPLCRSGFNIIVHHIVPLDQGGIDTEDNFIILCFECHTRYKRHSEFYNQEIMLSTWKYYAESSREYEKVQGKSEKPDLPLIEATIGLEGEIIETLKSERWPWKKAKERKKRGKKALLKRRIAKICKNNGGRAIRRGFLTPIIRLGRT